MEFNLLKQNNSLDTYYYYPKVYGDEEIEKILSISKNYKLEEGNVSGDIDRNYRKSKITWLPLNNETRFIYEKVVSLMENANKEMWNFNITNLVDSIQIAEYNDEHEDNNYGHYDWHIDFGHSSSTRKISLSIQLTDETSYEGGDLEFMINRSILKCPREKGTAILFPSYITHRVTDVTKGTRNSLVFWFHGPPFV